MIVKTENISLLEFVYGFYRGIRSHEIVLAYEGEMNHQLMMDFTGITMGKMDGEQVARQIQKKVYHVMVECIQNISRHAFLSHEMPAEEMNHGVLVVSKNKEEYLVTTGNIIEMARAPQLNELLERINTMNRRELDTLYREQLRNGKFSEKGGAGLGFIDIRRKTGQMLEFHFLPIDQTHCFFLLISRIMCHQK